MNMILRAAAVAGAPAIAATPAVASTAAAPDDPVLAQLAAYNKASEAKQQALEILLVAERELTDLGANPPHVFSVGNPSGNGPGYKPPASLTHEDIDLYSPADMYPERNREEHAALSAAISRRDARLNPLMEALKEAEFTEEDALDDVINTEPTTLKGALAVIDVLACRFGWVNVSALRA